VEALRVIGVAMAEAGVAGIGRLTLSRRERMVKVEPRGTAMALFTLRAADEVQPAQFASARGRPRCRDGRDRPRDHQTAHREIRPEHVPRSLPTGVTGADRSQAERVAIQPREVIAPPPVIDLMAALKRSLAQETPVAGGATGKKSEPNRQPMGANGKVELVENPGHGPRTCLRPPLPGTVSVTNFYNARHCSSSPQIGCVVASSRLAIRSDMAQGTDRTGRTC
jgi:hypothetical protein